MPGAKLDGKAMPRQLILQVLQVGSHEKILQPGKLKKMYRTQRSISGTPVDDDIQTVQRTQSSP